MRNAGFISSTVGFPVEVLGPSALGFGLLLLLFLAAILGVNHENTAGGGEGFCPILTDCNYCFKPLY